MAVTTREALSNLWHNSNMLKLTKIVLLTTLFVMVLRLHVMYAPMFISQAELTEFLIESANTGRALPSEWPEWISQACPGVVNHFRRFPYFDNFTKHFSVMTTLFAAHSVCSFHLAHTIAEAVGTHLYLHAGSHLGAFVHGGPMPWDDDTDGFLAFHKRDAFMTLCARHTNIGPGARLECVYGHNAIKLSVVTADSHKTRRGWMSPFVDIFLYKIDPDNERIVEVSPGGSPRLQSYSLSEYFPTRPFYFGGVTLFGPPDAISARRYNVSRCVASCFHHRLERSNLCKGHYDVDCNELKKYFPFATDDDEIIDQNGAPVSLVDRRSIDTRYANNTWFIADSEREKWLRTKSAEGEALTLRVPSLNAVEIDNSISVTCGKGSTSNDHDLVVVEFNAERGTRWLQTAELLRPLNADIIILNEMDIGMARSDQQHTTRLLAFELGMNYAWGLEFVELTRGTAHEQEITVGMKNSMGLHGNAILSRCPIESPIVFRDPVGKYFDDRKNSINAGGYERRLGGRMAMLVKVKYHTGATIVAGSVHKISNEHNFHIRSYIGNHTAVVAGDQEWGFCERVSLAHVDNAKHNTYPASCTSLGHHRGDIICSNARVRNAERTIHPCTRPWGIDTQLSDHAVTYVTLSISSGATR